MKISVIIPALNEEQLLPVSIESARRSGADEIIVADGGSTDQTRKLAIELGCQLVSCARGRGRQLNAGAAAASGEVLLFLHADAELIGNCCDQIRQSLRLKEIRCGAFTQQIASKRWIYRLIESGNAARIRWLSMAYGDQGIFVTRELFNELGGFKELPLMEDFEFSSRLRKVTRYRLLAGPIRISARRWEQVGPIRQTLRNWSIVAAWMRGVEPAELARRYYRRIIKE